MKRNIRQHKRRVEEDWGIEEICVSYRRIFFLKLTTGVTAEFSGGMGLHLLENGSRSCSKVNAYFFVRFSNVVLGFVL